MLSRQELNQTIEEQIDFDCSDKGNCWVAGSIFVLGQCILAKCTATEASFPTTKYSVCRSTAIVYHHTDANVVNPPSGVNQNISECEAQSLQEIAHDDGKPQYGE